MAMGSQFVRLIQTELDRCCEPLFGYHLLKLGPLSAELSCRASHIPHQINVGSSHFLTGVVAELEQLPFEEGSVDVCLLAHTLDYCRDPHQVLREVERVLTGDGTVIITGFNPFSYQNLRRFIPYYRRQLPWSGQMFSPHRIKDWLNLLGFEVIEHQYLGGGSGGRLCEMAQCCGGTFSFVYLLVARKRRVRLTPIRPRWRLRQRLTVPELEGVSPVSRKNGRSSS